METTANIHSFCAATIWLRSRLSVLQFSKESESRVHVCLSFFFFFYQQRLSMTFLNKGSPLMQRSCQIPHKNGEKENPPESTYQSPDLTLPFGGSCWDITKGPQRTGGPCLKNHRPLGRFQSPILLLECRVPWLHAEPRKIRFGRNLKGHLSQLDQFVHKEMRAPKSVS